MNQVRERKVTTYPPNWLHQPFKAITILIGLYLLLIAPTPVLLFALFYWLSDAALEVVWEKQDE